LLFDLRKLSELNFMEMEVLAFILPKRSMRALLANTNNLYEFQRFVFDPNLLNGLRS